MSAAVIQVETFLSGSAAKQEEPLVGSAQNPVIATELMMKSPSRVKLEAMMEGLGGAVAVAVAVAPTSPRTPPRSPVPVPTISPKKSPFANSIYEHIPPVVKKLYRVIQKHTGSVGGYGHAGAIYGELTMGAFQKIVNFLKEHNRFDSSSLFLDIGAGLGKPNFHVSGDPAVKVSFGVELEQLRWELSLHNLMHVLAEVPELKSLSEQPSIFFARDDITNTETFEPFTHLYSFDVGFPPAVMRHMATAFNRSTTPLVFVSFHKPRKMVAEYGFNVDLCGTVSASMCGSNEGHTAYVYRHVVNYRRLFPDDLIVRPSLAINLTPKTTQTRLDDYLKHVKQTATPSRLFNDDDLQKKKTDKEEKVILVEELITSSSPSKKQDSISSTSAASTTPRSSKRKVLEQEEEAEAKRARVPGTKTPVKSPLAVRLFDQVEKKAEQPQPDMQLHKETFGEGPQTSSSELQQLEEKKTPPRLRNKTPPSRASSRRTVARRKTMSALKTKLPSIEEQFQNSNQQNQIQGQEEEDIVSFDTRKRLFEAASGVVSSSTTTSTDLTHPAVAQQIDRVFSQGFDILAAMKAEASSNVVVAATANIDRDGGVPQDKDVVEKYRIWVKSTIEGLQNGSRTPRKASQSPTGRGGGGGENTKESPSRGRASASATTTAIKSPARSPGRKGRL